MLTHAFTTPILRDTAALTPAQFDEIREHLLGLRVQAEGEQKSNRGGWHSKGNLFAPAQRQFPEMREAVTRALFAYIAKVFAYTGPIEIALNGWTVINRGGGDFNVPHNHAANLLSGALYIAVPDGMRGGAIVFQDPRLNLNAHETEGMRKLAIKPPWMRTSINVTPKAGEILVFPSWLMHFVEPFTCDDPEGVRIVVSFNATV